MSQFHFNIGSEKNEGTSEDKERKVPALRKVEKEVMRRRRIFLAWIDSFVKQEVEAQLEKKLACLKWNSEDKIHPSESRSLKLMFLDNISCPVFTGIHIGGEVTTLKVVLIDALTGDVVKSGPEASARLEIVVLDKDFDGDERGNWTFEEFNSKIVTGWKGKKSLLGGNTHLNLIQGIGIIRAIYFRHTKYWMRPVRFRLGARLVDISNGTRVKAAKTESFLVKDRRGILNKKHYPPSPSDEVWRLDSISKGGAFHRRLTSKSIKTVEDFLNQFNLNPQGLRDILGTSMSAKTWEATVNHANTCKRDTSFLPGPSHSSNPSPHGCSFGISQMIDSLKHTQLSTSFMGIPSPVHSIANASNPGDSGLHNYSNMNHINDQSSSFPSQATNSLFLDLDDPHLDLDKWLQYFSEDPGLESHAIQQGTFSHMLRHKKPRRRWTKAFNALRWLWRFVGLKRIPAAKKRRFC